MACIQSNISNLVSDN